MPDSTKYGLPYRTPCGGWSAVQQIADGPPFQRRRTADSAPLIPNTTTVLLPGTTVPVAPFPLVSCTGSNMPSADGECPEETTPIAGQDCGPWLASSPGRACPPMLPYYGGSSGPSVCSPSGARLAVLQACATNSTLTADWNCLGAGGSVVPSTLDFSSCRKIGFKNVQAVKSWHGQFGFLSHDPTGRISRKQYEAPTSGQCGVIGTAAGDSEDQQFAPDTIKYLTLTINATITNQATASGITTVNMQGEITETCSIARYSGVATFLRSLFYELNPGDAANVVSPDTGNPGVAECIAGHAGLTALTALTTYRAHYSGDGDWVESTSADGISWTATGPTVTATDGSGISQTDTMTLNIEAGSLTIVRWGLNYTGAVEQTWNESLSFTNTSFSHNITANTYCPSRDDYATNILACTGALSAPYANTDLQSDIIELHDTWDLGNDRLYPWREDSYVTVAPLVSRDEVVFEILPNAFFGNGSDDPAWTGWLDPNAAQYTGRMVGNPYPVGTERIFDWDHRNWTKCLDHLGVPHWYIASWGAWNRDAAYLNTTLALAGATITGNSPASGLATIKLLSLSGLVPGSSGAITIAGAYPAGFNVSSATFVAVDAYTIQYSLAAPISGSATTLGTATISSLLASSSAQIPRTAPQWTENVDASAFWPGAWQWYGANGFGLLSNLPRMWSQKWVESRIPRPSENFARPCGRDRYTMDETTVACGWHTGTGSTGPIVSVATGGPFSPSVNDLVFARGIAGVPNGQWKVTAVGSPSGGATPYTLGSLVRVGGTGNPALNLMDDYRTVGSGIIGKLRWPSAPGIGGRVVITQATWQTPVQLTLDARWLQTGDTLVVSGCTGNTGANGTFAIVVLDANTVTLTGSIGNGFYTGNGYAACSNSVVYWFDDDNPKGDFLTPSWFFRYRDLGEYARIVTNGGWIAGCSWGRTAPTQPRPYQAGHGMPQPVSYLSVGTACLSWNITNPVVLAWVAAHGQDTLPISYISVMPAFTPDERYGALWQGGYVQHWTDPLWQTPALPCATISGPPTTYSPQPCPWLPDNGSCEGDVLASQCLGGTFLTGAEMFYAHPPMVEARNGVPVVNGQPAPLPAGVSISIISTDTLNSTASPLTGIVLVPPAQVGSDDTGNIVQPETAWGLYLLELQSECASKSSYSLRFSFPYALNGVLC